MAAEDLPKDMSRKKFKERASVMFGRPSARGLQKQLDAMPKQQESCFDGCFAALLGFPSEKSGGGSMQSYDAPQELGPLKPFRKWAELPAVVRGCFRCEVGSMPKEEVPGWINQDSTLACCTIGPEGESKGEPGMLPLLFGVFDGHGRNGHEVSETVADRLAGHLAEQEDLMANPAQKLEAAVKAADHDAYKRFADKIEYSGSTGVIVLADRVQRVLHVANVGDSRAVIGQFQPDAKAPRWDALELTKDCKPDLPEERERIELSGGTVAQVRDDDGTPVGPMRVWDDATLSKPGLATSRTFGDGCGRSVGVISTPVVTSHKLLPEDRFLLIASDGLWDSLGNDEAVRIAGKFIHIPQVAIKALLEAVRREEGGALVDDTTIVLVLFQ